MIGHVAPEASEGGPIASLRDGDIDHDRHREPRVDLDLEVSEAELAQRRAGFTPPPPRYTTGVFAKYAAMVSSAKDGAITRPRF